MLKKKKPRTKTQVSTIASAIRRIWQWSPEKAAIVKRANKHCEECGEPVSNTKKQQEKKSGKRLEIHHLEPVKMTDLAKMIHARLFPGADKLLGLCQDCHKEADAVINREKELT
jgi:hypothetical protein